MTSGDAVGYQRLSGGVAVLSSGLTPGLTQLLIELISDSWLHSVQLLAQSVAEEPTSRSAAHHGPLRQHLPVRLRATRSGYALFLMFGVFYTRTNYKTPTSKFSVVSWLDF